jgi:hypothetical protein
MANEYDEKNTEKKIEDASVELSVDDLEEAAGGYVVCSGHSQFEVVDDNTGDVRASTRSMIQAKRFAIEQRVRPAMITSDRYKELFGKEI